MPDAPAQPLALVDLDEATGDGHTLDSLTLRAEIDEAAAEAASLTVHASIVRDAAAFYRIDSVVSEAEREGRPVTASDVRRAYALSPLYQALTELADRAGDLAISLEEAGE